MGRNIEILELHTDGNTWTPPEIDIKEMAYSVRNDVNARQSNAFLHIFCTEPYIDSVYVEYDTERNPIKIKRFTFHKGYVWSAKRELFFHKKCIKSLGCAYQGGQLDRIYEIYNTAHPEWHIQRYLTKGLRLLDHIYNCIVKNTAKEMLYKSGLDELAAHIDEMDELNLLSSKPSDLYDDIPIRVLRSLNCRVGATLVSDYKRRQFIKELNKKFPDVFDEKLNDAQCRYVMYLVKGNLTIGETGRLFRSRKPALARIWIRSLFDIFMEREQHRKEIEELCKVIGKIDPIYEKYIMKTNKPEDNINIRHLVFYLGKNRKEYDLRIRRSNRKRDYDWQERGEEYYVRYPQTINDFCREAIYMQNCLLTFIEALINNDTTILFMRKSDDYNTPFITIEIYHGELMQAYHRFDKDCTQEEKKWIIDYCKRHNISTGRFKFDSNLDELY